MTGQEGWRGARPSISLRTNGAGTRPSPVPSRKREGRKEKGRAELSQGPGTGFPSISIVANESSSVSIRIAPDSASSGPKPSVTGCAP